MFGFPGKRPRETEEWGDACEERSPENKRLRPLTLRTSTSPFVHKPPVAPTTRITSRVGLSNLTPVESSEDEDDRKSRPPTRIDSRHALNPPPQSRSVSTEMDIDGGRDASHYLDPEPDSDPTSNLFQPSPLPSSRINESLTISDLRPLESGAGDAMPSLTPDHSHGPNPDGWCVPRLPSPVSDGADYSTSSRGSPSDTEMTFHPLSPRDQPRKWQVAADGPPRGFLVGSPDANQPSSSGATAATSKKKVGFSMGYRSDCDKCRRKVPGHYSHIIRD